MCSKNESGVSSDSDNESDMFCPALPPHLLQNKVKSERKTIVGPSLPANYQPSSVSDTDITSDGVVEDNYGDDSESEVSADVIGPLPPSAEEDDRFNVPEMEYRVKKLISDCKSKDSKELVREAWMLELPNDKPNILALGLGGPRQFRKKNKDDLGDRSVWTDTPEDKERKARLQQKNEPDSEISIEETAIKKRDEEMSEFVSKYEEKKRSIPLIESHQKKKKKTDELNPKERKPFSREDDLNVHKFDEAQKETIMKKARQLNDRFSSGNKKFL